MPTVRFILGILPALICRQISLCVISECEEKTWYMSAGAMSMERPLPYRQRGKGPLPRPLLINTTPSTRKPLRSEEHTSELQSLMRISYAVICLKKKTKTKHSTQY